MNQNPHNIFVIMQARVGSTRLPAKVLKTICGKTILEHDIERCLRIKNSKGVIIATTLEPDASQIVDICAKYPPEKVGVYRGSIDDVLARYYEAAKKYDAQFIVRITSDCPLLDYELAGQMIDVFCQSQKSQTPCDYLSNNNPPTYPHGLDIEIFSFVALEKAFCEAQEPYEREHVTPYIRRHPEMFTLRNYSQEKNFFHMRWTLDYPEDYEFVKSVYERLYPENPFFTTPEILALLEAHPEICAINEGRRQR
ncbi:MAG TPA: glycosyltransferase family protein [Candidatus Sumerlaeota bacterium]|jgi:spore coat polysaccharide biosynthesis protein SpsF|nr:glycosyltransferase family protein [Candidatus Sumerlaeota bacterium]HRR30761.1 glycosyltransferase family protein [Candidatus Sumerlaeia bacterium]HON50121.1 glycosyltransferase family protein [Candidatus Sumerlaeota bacterium]HOR63337.1 glycosyltransferase family protein [Candidatus Sumerlaeota bacterium]HPL74088.1 glycosyltransferase family protein [Candidatus Sumerlaeota bacterium]